MPRLLDQTTVQMRKGMNDKLMPPRFLLEKVLDQCNALAAQEAAKSPFAQPFSAFPKSFAESDQKRLRESGLAAIKESVLPAYARFTAFVRDEYVPRGRSEPGVWSLPDGEAYYTFLVKQSTTTSLTPEEIHQLGLAQVKEIEARMLATANKLGYKDLKSFKAAIAADPKMHGQSRQQILDLYRKYIEQMYVKLPDLFDRLPKAKLEVMPIEEFREQGAPGAQYFHPPQTARAPATFWSIPAISKNVPSSTSKQPPIMKVFPVIICRLLSLRKCRACRPSAKMNPSMPTLRVGPFTPSGSAKNWVSTRTPIDITAT